MGVYETTYGMNMSSTYIFALIVVKKVQISMSIRWNSCPNHYIVAVPLTYSTIWRSFFTATIKSFSSIWMKIDTKTRFITKKYFAPVCMSNIDAQLQNWVELRDGNV